MMLVLAALFTPVTIATGIVIWRVDYQFRSYRRIRYLIALSAVIMSLELVCLYLRIPGPVGEGGEALIYNGIMLLLGPLAGLAGYNGGQLVYPTNK
jgi:hypothetical protein